MRNSWQGESWLEQARWGILMWLLVGALLTAIQYLPRSVDGAITLSALNPLWALVVKLDPAKPPVASFADLQSMGMDPASKYLPPLNLLNLIKPLQS